METTITAGMLLSVAGILVGFYWNAHKENKEEADLDKEEKKTLSISFAKMDVKQDAILSSINEIRIDQKKQDKKIEDLQKQVIVVEQSVKSAHSRIDDVVERKEHNHV